MTEKKPAELSQLELIYHTAPMGIALLDKGLNFIHCNSALLRKLNYSIQELQSLSLLELCHPWDRSKMRSMIERTRQTSGNYFRDDFRLTPQNDSYLWTEISLQHTSTETSSSNNFVTIIQNIQHRKTMELELKELRRKLMARSDLERKRLAQELHDGPQQDLHSIVYQLSTLEDKLPEDLRSQLKGSLETIRNVNQSLRAISNNLRPPVLSQFGLAKSIKTHLDTFEEKHPEISTEHFLVDDQGVIAEEISLVLYRIYQQAMGNIIKHGNATKVTINLNMDGDQVELIISDNGQGFVVPQRWISLVREGHYGLAGSRERVLSIGGDFQVQSSPGMGTTILVRLPDYLE